LWESNWDTANATYSDEWDYKGVFTTYQMFDDPMPRIRILNWIIPPISNTTTNETLPVWPSINQVY